MEWMKIEDPDHNYSDSFINFFFQTFCDNYSIKSTMLPFSFHFSFQLLKLLHFVAIIHRNKTLVWKTPCNQIPFRLSSGAEHRRIFRLANSFYSVCKDYQNATFFLKITQPSHQVHFVAAIYWKWNQFIWN